ncbi:hypothetical protein D9M68_750490 [compost metagenome]
MAGAGEFRQSGGRVGAGMGQPAAECLRQAGRIPQAQVQALACDGVQGLGGIADRCHAAVHLGAARAERQGEDVAGRLAGQAAQAVAEGRGQRLRKGGIVQRGQFGGTAGRAAPDDRISVRRLRMRQQGQRAFRREAFPGPAAAGQGCMGRGQHGMLTVVAAHVGRAGAVGLHGNLA